MEFESYLEQANQENKRFVERTITKTLKYWWVVAVSLLVALIVAFLTIRYSSKIYSIGAKVMIESTDKGIDPTSLLFGDQLLQGNQEVVNELIILKSYPIVRKTVIDQAQNIHYFRTTTALERVIEIEPVESPYVVEVIGDWAESKGADFDKPLIVEAQGENLKIRTSGDDLIAEGSFGEQIMLLDEEYVRVSPNPTFRLEQEGLQYMFKINSIDQTVHFYQDNLRASILEEKSSIISINLEGALASKETHFLAKLLDNYLSANLQEKNQGASNTIDFINAELLSIKDSLKKIEGRLEAFKSRNQISNLQTEGQQIFERLLQLEEEKAQYQLRQKYLDLVTEYLNDSDQSKLVTPSGFGIEDQTLNNLTNDLIRVETERNLLGENSESEIALQLTARINELRKTLKNYVENVSSTNELQLDDIRRRIALVEGTIEDLPVSEIALMNIERLHKLSESLYLLLLEKKAEAEITKSSNTPDIKVVENARKLSSEPIKPNKKIFYGGFFLLGLAAPFAWILISVYLDRSIRSKDEITRSLDLPFMGYISSAQGKAKDYVLEQPKSRLAETFRTLRSNLKYLTKEEEGAQVILISSCFPGEGKTFVSSNLGRSIASAGRRVLVIGADLRKPQLQDQFGLSNDRGLSNFLVGNLESGEMVSEVSESLHIIVSGPIPPNPLELLDSDRFFGFLQEAKKSYDYVIIDTSPFVLVSDATALFRKADINLIVLRSGVSKRDNLKIVEELAHESSDCRFGVVLNDHDHSHEYGYGKGYGNGYGYYQE